MAAVGCAALAGLAGAPVASAGFGEVRVLAPFPADPGFPEGVAVHGDRVYAAGAATFGTTGAGPSAVLEYDRATGATIRRYDTLGENLAMEHANSSIAFDGSGRLYVLNTQLGIYRLTPGSGLQESYTPPFADLKPCAPVIGPPPCSPTPADAPPIPNDIAFAPDGSAYVSDSTQATVWRVAPGGGSPQIWFQDERLASPYIGTNGLRLDPAGTRVYLTVSADLLGRGSVYSLPLVAGPTAADLELFHRFDADELADGIAFGATGDLYVALADPGHAGVKILRPDGSVRGHLGNGSLPALAPYDGPANIAFDGAGRILLTNHAPATGLALRRFSILDADVEDTGAALFAP